VFSTIFAVLEANNPAGQGAKPMVQAAQSGAGENLPEPFDLTCRSRPSQPIYEVKQ